MLQQVKEELEEALELLRALHPEDSTIPASSDEILQLVLTEGELDDRLD